MGVAGFSPTSLTCVRGRGRAPGAHTHQCYAGLSGRVTPNPPLWLSGVLRVDDHGLVCVEGVLDHQSRHVAPLVAALLLVGGDPQPFPDLAAALRSQVKPIIKAWAEQVRLALPKLQSLSFKELQDHLPVVLRFEAPVATELAQPAPVELIG